MALNIDVTFASSEAIEAAIGEQLRAIRLSGNISQAQLAGQAGVSRRTITRLESGDGTSLDTFIRVVQALGLADHLNSLLPTPEVRPIERVRGRGRERQRARPAANQSEPPLWSWRAPQDDQ